MHDGRHFGRHLGFYRKLEIIKKRLKLEVFDVGHEEYGITIHFTSFTNNQKFLLKNGLITCYL